MSADGAAAFRQAAQALNEAGDKTVRKEVYAAFRKIARPLGERMIAEGAAGMPRRGGLAARVAATKLSQANATTGSNPSVSIRLRVREGYDLKAFDAGTIRHPVFARPGVRRTWAKTSIRAGAFTRPFEAGKSAVADELIKALERVNADIIRHSGGMK